MGFKEGLEDFVNARKPNPLYGIALNLLAICLLANYTPKIHDIDLDFWLDTKNTHAINDSHNGSHGKAPENSIKLEETASIQEPIGRESLDLFINKEAEDLIDLNVKKILEDTYAEKTWKYVYNKNMNQVKVPTTIHVPVLDKISKEMRNAFKYSDYIKQASEKYNVPEELIYSVVCVESEGDPKKKSRAGAAGHMQLMPETARSLGLMVTDKSDERLDPEKNIMAGTKYLSELIQKYNGNVMLAAAAYNCGPTRINKMLKRKGIEAAPEQVDWSDINLPRETRNYVIKVLSRAKILYEHSPEIFLNERHAS